MGPDPEKIKRDNFNTNENYIINEIEEEMDVEVEENLGYIPLQNNDHEELPANDSTDEEEEVESDVENESFQPYLQQPIPNVAPIISSSAEIQAEIWNAPTVSNIEITSEKSQEITKIMSEFKLPNAPDWINEINTETLINRLKNQQQ